MSAIDDLMSRMTQGTEVVSDLRAILYGESGTGKTVLAMQLAQAITPPELGIIFADARQGWAVMANHPDLQERTMVLPVESLDDLTTMATALAAREGMFGYVGTVVVDESSVLANDNIMSNLRERLGVPKTKVVKAIPEWPDYNASKVETSNAIAQLESVPGINVIQVAHVRYDTNKATGAVVSGPDFPKQLSQALRRDSHLVAHLVAKLDKASDQDAPEYIREVQVNPSALVIAKSRIGGLPVKIHPDTLVSEVALWLTSEGELAPEDVPLAEDELLTDGETPADPSEQDDDDAPAFSSAD